MKICIVCEKQIVPNRHATEFTKSKQRYCSDCKTIALHARGLVNNCKVVGMSPLDVVSRITKSIEEEEK